MNAHDDDEYEKFVAEVRAWAEPITDRILDEARSQGLQTPPDCPAADLREMTTALVGGIAAVLFSESLKDLQPRSAQEAGVGTIRFKRDADGELCVKIDGTEEPAERMSVRDAYFLELWGHGYAPELAELSAKLVEEALLSGKARPMSFAYDVEGSTFEEAVYVWKASDEEREEIREKWREFDERSQ